MASVNGSKKFSDKLSPNDHQAFKKEWVDFFSEFSEKLMVLDSTFNEPDYTFNCYILQKL